MSNCLQRTRHRGCIYVCYSSFIIVLRINKVKPRIANNFYVFSLALPSKIACPLINKFEKKNSWGSIHAPFQIGAKCIRHRVLVIFTSGFVNATAAFIKKTSLLSKFHRVPETVSGLVKIQQQIHKRIRCFILVRKKN